MSVLAYTLMGGLSIFVREFARFDENKDFIAYSTNPNLSYTFDFIIVGSGSSGSILANRLSMHFSVLVIEAGGEPNPLMKIPLLALGMTCQPDVDWMYQTIPQTNACLSLHNKRSNWPRGKVEGGSSNLNAMIYLRGNPEDFDNWAAKVDDPIWSYKRVAEFYKKFENFNDNYPGHGHDGEMNVEKVSLGPLVKQFIEAGQELGYNWVDLNSDHVEGFAPLTITTRNGARWEGYSAFLEPAKSSSAHRLTVYKFATATKILFDKHKAAYGVEYVKFGKTHTALARKEVIIACGVINSPKLLMNSGIGPRKHLESVDIEVIVDLPGVGQNLQDHVGSAIGIFSVDQPLTYKIESLGPGALIEYFVRGTGPLSNSGTHAVASIASSFAKKEAQESDTKVWPDIQITLIAASAGTVYKEGLHLANINEDHVVEFWDQANRDDINAFQMFVLNSRPKQRGEILLADSDPLTPPLIDPKYLQNQQDVDVTVEGIQLSVDLVEKTKVFKDLGGKLLPVPLKPCAKEVYASRAYWECFLRHMTFTYHPCCTAQMGPKHNLDAVVDSRFNVYGVKNLRVIDASVPPDLPTSNLNSISTLIGEIGFHAIVEQWTGAKMDT